jgi:hypothetical protein
MCARSCSQVKMFAPRRESTSAPMNPLSRYPTEPSSATPHTIDCRKTITVDVARTRRTTGQRVLLAN